MYDDLNVFFLSSFSFAQSIAVEIDLLFIVLNFPSKPIYYYIEIRPENTRPAGETLAWAFDFIEKKKKFK